MSRRLYSALRNVLLIGSLIAANGASADTLRYGHVNSSYANPLDEIGWGLHRGIVQAELSKIGIDEITYSVGMVGPDLNDALNSGSLDVVTYGDGPAIVARSIGTPTRLIDFSSVSRQSIIVTRPDWPDDLQQLDGKKIAVVIGSTMHRQAEEFLAKQGVKPNFVSGGNDLSLLRSGSVDAIATWPYGAQINLLIDEGYKVVWNSVDHQGFNWTLLTVATDDFLAKHPDLPLAWSKARLAALEDIRNNEDDFYAWFAEQTKVDPALARKLYPLDQISKGTSEENQEGVALLQSALEILTRNGRIAESFDVNEWIAR